jgi:hypothetical protein
VKISPVWDGDGKTERTMKAERSETAERQKDLPSGAVLCGMAGFDTFDRSKGGGLYLGDNLVA